MTANQTHGPAIHVRGLEKSYKKLEVLRGVEFDVARGSIFALLRSNGAGKTTVVKILSTLLKADAGTASVNGFDVAMQTADVGIPSASLDSSRPSTRSSAGGRTWCRSPSCGTSRTRARSRMTCSSASR
ncbi:MAG TPA: ATP-binding cassette domain-containing protein [Propionibacteriaceae bacterium]|nr:ATP-binding cassette domain-containing protein [Propionibacteriaceae bacterium]